MFQKAQSTIELIAIITFVTLGIFFIGPTVIRSVNAHFKLWDDSVYEAHTDPLVKADQPPDIPGGCTCTDFIPRSCGASPCRTTEKLYSRDCNPVDCGRASGMQMVRCEAESECCEPSTDLACCEGETATPPVNCPIGNRATRSVCGGGETAGSRPDPTCDPVCHAPYNPNAAAANEFPTRGIICNLDDQGIPPVPDANDLTTVDRVFGIPLTYVDNANSCTEEKKCEVYCTDGYEPDNTRTSCVPSKCNDLVIAVTFNDPNNPDDPVPVGCDGKGSLLIDFSQGILRRWTYPNDVNNSFELWSSEERKHGNHLEVTVHFKDGTAHTTKLDSSTNPYHTLPPIISRHEIKLPGQWTGSFMDDWQFSNFSRGDKHVITERTGSAVGFHCDDSAEDRVGPVWFTIAPIHLKRNQETCLSYTRAEMHEFNFPEGVSSASIKAWGAGGRAFYGGGGGGGFVSATINSLSPSQSYFIRPGNHNVNGAGRPTDSTDTWFSSSPTPFDGNNPPVLIVAPNGQNAGWGVVNQVADGGGKNGLGFRALGVTNTVLLAGGDSGLGLSSAGGGAGNGGMGGMTGDPDSPANGKPGGGTLGAGGGNGGGYIPPTILNGTSPGGGAAGQRIPQRGGFFSSGQFNINGAGQVDICFTVPSNPCQ